jgi:uncharacterized repeat protein (TIGR04042 family)
MPEIYFKIQWPDGQENTCYSPSLIVKEYFEPHNEYTLDDFVKRSQTALHIASDRVLAKYGMHCSRALAQLQQIETTAAKHQNLLDPKVQFLDFL